MEWSTLFVLLGLTSCFLLLVAVGRVLTQLHAQIAEERIEIRKLAQEVRLLRTLLADPPWRY